MKTTLSFKKIDFHLLMINECCAHSRRTALCGFYMLFLGIFFYLFCIFYSRSTLTVITLNHFIISNTKTKN